MRAAIRDLAPSFSVGGLVLLSLLIAPAATSAGVGSSACPANAIAIAPGATIQAAVDLAGDGAAFCLENGVHRTQAVRPRSKQRFYGEGQTVLNGSQLLSGFRREGDYWLANSQLQVRPRHGECLPSAPFCNQPEALFIDDRPLSRVSSKDALASNKFYIDHAGGKIYLADDPTKRTVEVTVAPFAFESAAADVSISNVTVEKFASAAQKGAIHAREGASWLVDNCEVRFNSGAGISVGTGSRVRNCDIHHNGQIGIEGNGGDIRIEDSHIWSNNIHGFDATWKRAESKIAESDGVTFRGNHVHDNDGPGLWCDIDCRNVVYEENLVENNRDIGIFHEISFRALIRNNVVRHNGLGKRGWFWGADIVLCGVRGRRGNGQQAYSRPRKMRDHADRPRTSRQRKEIPDTQQRRACQRDDVRRRCLRRWRSDAKPGDENFAIITDGDNRFDGNTYRVGDPDEPARFVWGHDVTDWNGFRRKGLERNGRLVTY